MEIKNMTLEELKQYKQKLEKSLRAVTHQIRVIIATETSNKK